MKYGVIEFQYLNISYNEEINGTHGMISFFSPFLENNAKSSQILIPSDREILFDAEKLPVLSFILASPDFLKTVRVVLALWAVVVDGESQVCGNCSLALRNVIEFIQKSYKIDYRISFNTNKSVEFEQNLEFQSRIIGKVRGSWTYNICSRSEQYRI